MDTKKYLFIPSRYNRAQEDERWWIFKDYTIEEQSENVVFCRGTIVDISENIKSTVDNFTAHRLIPQAYFGLFRWAMRVTAKCTTL